MPAKLKQFLVTYHAPASAMKKMQTASQEEMNAGYAAWMAWAKKCGKNLETMGDMLHGGVNIKASGPATPSKRKVTGYSKLKAANMGAAKKLVKNHPHLSWARGCEIEIHEVMEMG